MLIINLINGVDIRTKMFIQWRLCVQSEGAVVRHVWSQWQGACSWLVNASVYAKWCSWQWTKDLQSSRHVTSWLWTVAHFPTFHFVSSILCHVHLVNSDNDFWLYSLLDCDEYHLEFTLDTFCFMALIDLRA